MKKAKTDFWFQVLCKVWTFLQYYRNVNGYFVKENTNEKEGYEKQNNAVVNLCQYICKKVLSKEIFMKNKIMQWYFDKIISEKVSWKTK